VSVIKFKKTFAPETYEVTRLELIDRGKEYYDRYVVRFNGQELHWGYSHEEALEFYENQKKEYFND